MMKLKGLLGLLIGVTAVGVTAVVLTRPWQTLAVRAATQTVLTIVNPEQDAVVPVHASIPVQATAYSRPGIRKLSLYVNNQLWGEREYEASPQTVEEIWSWTPSGEGLHHLRLQVLNGLNEIIDSDVTVVAAALAADIRFPIDFTTQGGETLDDLAQRFETDPEAIRASNPLVDFSAALPSDEALIIPVPVPNAPPGSPETGLAPAAPLPFEANPPVPIGEPPGENDDADDTAPPSLSQINLPVSPGFEIYQGKVLPYSWVDKLYLYVSIAGGPWQRIPADDQTFLDPSPLGFDVTDHFPIPEGAEFFEPIPFVARAWGWAGTQLVYLGEDSGTFMLDLENLPVLVMTQTRLDIRGVVRDDVEFVSEWTIPEPVPDYYYGYFLVFRWSSALENVAGGMYQVSLTPFNPTDGLFPPGVIASKMVAGPKVVTQSLPLFGVEKTTVEPGLFGINFTQFIDLPEEDNKSWFEKLVEAAKNAANNAKGQVSSTQQLSINSPQDLVLSSQPNLNWTPNTFYVRVVPIVNNAFNTEASNTVIVRYGPPQVEPISSELGGAYEVEVVSFTPYRPVDSSYAGCMVLERDLKYCTSPSSGNFWQAAISGEEPDPVCQTLQKKGTLSCGCPGVKCESSGGGCGWNPFCHLANWAEAGINMVKDFVSAVAQFYNDFKDAVVGFVADLGCSALSGEANSVCKGLVNLGVNIALTSMGIPPELPDFEKLMDQGLEYAFETAVAQVTGCDATCQAAIKKGLEILADPEKALDEGLNIGVEFAKEQLEQQGIPCDSFCQDLMKDVATGEVDKGKLLDKAFEEAAQEAADYLKKKGYDCDSACEALIEEQLQKGAGALNLGQSGLPKGQELNFWKPHPLALEQPATMVVRVTRRPETAAVPTEHLEGCSLSIYNQASNTYLGTSISGKLFEGVGLGIPALQPGDALTIPILLNRAPWYLPASFSPAAPQPGGVVYATLTDPFYGEWTALYYGSSATFNFTGNNFLTVDDLGQSIGLPCVEPATWSSDIPASP